MALAAIFVLALAVQNGLRYVIGSQLTWPEEYHFNAEEINMVSGVVKPFEIWYSEQYNRSRIDLFGGIVQRYNYAEVDDEDKQVDAKIYMMHYEADKDGNDELKCDTAQNWYDQKDFLPELNEFNYAGTTEHDGLEVQVYSNEKTLKNIARIDMQLLVLETEDGVGIPIQRVDKMFTLENGGLREHSIINYYNFHSNIELKDLQVNTDACYSWEFDESFAATEKYLHLTIPLDVDLAFHSYIKDNNSKNLGYTLAVNHFADKTDPELKSLTGLDINGPIRMGTHPYPHTKKELEEIASELPEEYDLRIEGYVSPIRNQAGCGSCWVFAATATVETAYARKSESRLLDLSEQSLVDCAWQYQSHGCEGTEALDAVYRYILDHGIPTVEEYGPYMEEDGKCNIKNMPQVYGIKGFVQVTPMSPNALKAALKNSGAVMIAVLATRNMVFYNSGVFYDLTCEPGAMNHAVTLVGYGTRDGDLYWIVKNSWGQTWGQDGYILISANDNNCNVMASPYYPIV